VRVVDGVEGSLMQLSPGRRLYNGLSAAIERRDLAAVESFYRHDAVQMDVDSGQVFSGRAAIAAAVEDTIAAAGPIRVVALEKVAEHGDAVGVEA
jgi:ketosteroid isomerase-like protein